MRRVQTEENKVEKPSVMNYGGSAASENDEQKEKVLLIAALVVLVSPILGIESARKAISGFKYDSIDLNASDNTKNF